MWGKLPLSYNLMWNSLVPKSAGELNKVEPSKFHPSVSVTAYNTFFFPHFILIMKLHTAQTEHFAQRGIDKERNCSF